MYRADGRRVNCGGGGRGRPFVANLTKTETSVM